MDTILYEVSENVAVISLNRPEKHNAMDTAMSETLAALFAKAQADSDVRAILLQGKGKSFCSGRDTSALGVRTPGVSDFAHVSRSQKRKFDMLDSQKPIIAALRGHAIGGGFEIALHCDMRVASETARMSLPEIDHGIITDGGGSVITASLAGSSRAKYMLMTCDTIGAEQALQWGLVDFVVADNELEAFAFELAAKIAARPPVHVAMAKILIDGLHGESIRRGIREELIAISALYRTDDRQEAKTARQEKRKPKFKGL